MAQGKTGDCIASIFQVRWEVIKKKKKNQHSKNLGYCLSLNTERKFTTTLATKQAHNWNGLTYYPLDNVFIRKRRRQVRVDGRQKQQQQQKKRRHLLQKKKKFLNLLSYSTYKKAWSKRTVSSFHNEENIWKGQIKQLHC